MNMNWGKELKDIRLDMGISQDKMARLLGYSSKHRISEIESGKRSMSLQSVKCVRYAYRLFKMGLLDTTDYM